ncbi:MAG: DsbA family protein [Rhodocyclaceae bacterium]|nr:MAG: DsbA family protein [Rhodocyclaceae bacterium]
MKPATHFLMPLLLASACAFAAPTQAAKKDEGALADAVVQRLESSGALDKAVDRAIDRRIRQDAEARQKAAEEAQKKRMEMVANLRKVDPARDHVYGPVEAKYSILVYSDLECPFCKRFAGVAEGLADKSPQVNVVWRHFPLEMHGANALKESYAAECVAKQAGHGGFFKFVDAVFRDGQTNGQGLPGGDTALGQLAKQAGAGDEKSFNRCLADAETAKVIGEDIKDGIGGGIEGTPGVVLRDNASGRSLLVGGAIPPAALEARLNAFLAEKP